MEDFFPFECVLHLSRWSYFRRSNIVDFLVDIHVLVNAINDIFIKSYTAFVGDSAAAYLAIVAVVIVIALVIDGNGTIVLMYLLMPMGRLPTRMPI